MQIKEFKEKEVDVKDKSLSNKVYFAVGGIVLAVILIVAVFIKVNEFDIRDYIKPVYTGADGYASVTFVVDEDALSNKLLGKKADDDKKYYVRKFIESINVYTTDTDIKNGDKVHCENLMILMQIMQVLILIRSSILIRLKALMQVQR